MEREVVHTALLTRAYTNTCTEVREVVKQFSRAQRNDLQILHFDHIYNYIENLEREALGISRVPRSHVRRWEGVGALTRPRLIDGPS